VADEVRKLAEQTMQATGVVARNIKEIQNAAKDSADGMGSTLASVRDATGLTHNSGEELKAIVVSVDTSALRVEDITEVARQQSATAQEVIAAVEQSSEATRLVIEDMKNMSASVQSMAARANDLNALVKDMVSTGSKE
jgi:methyl-accepting chemotaxis protein